VAICKLRFTQRVILNTKCRARKKAVKDFCFPEGVHLNTSEQIIPKISFENTFVFTLNGTAIDGKKLHKGNEFGWIYCICLKLNVPINRAPYRAPKILCFMTYYDYFDFFLHALWTISSLSQMSDNYFEVKPSLKAKNILKDLYETDIECLLNITVPSSNNNGLFTFKLAKYEAKNKAAAFLCPQMFSILTAHDLYNILCNILLERSTIFVSKNLSLLSSTILAFCGLLSPFKWEHIVIPIVPNICLEMLEAPVPFIMGIPKSVDEGVQLVNDNWCQDTMIVLLDIGKVMTCSGYKKIKMPRLNGLEKAIEMPIKLFKNSRPDYKLNAEQEKTVVGICKTIENSLQKGIIDKLPKEITGQEDRSLTHHKILDTLVKGVEKADKEFIEQFRETQILYSFLEKYYVL